MIALGMVACLVGAVLIVLGLSGPRIITRDGKSLDAHAFRLGVAVFVVGLLLWGIGAARASEAPARPGLSGIALTEETCGVTVAMLLTARAMSAAGVDRAAAGRAMALMYDLRDVRDEQAERTREEITDIGYRHTEAPQDLAGVWALKCLGLVRGAAGARMSMRF